MTGKELYEKYAGKKAKTGGIIGVVCGYCIVADDLSLIMAVDKGCFDTGWDVITYDDIIVTNEDNPSGYWYVETGEIID